MIKSFGKLFAGTAVAQIVNFLMMPLLARVYSAEEFGVYGVFVTLSGILVILCLLQIHQIILIEKNKNLIKEYIGEVFFFGFVLSVVFGALVGLYFWVNYKYAIGTGVLILILSIAFMYGNCIVQVLLQLMVREGLFEVVAFNTLFKVILLNVFQLSVGTFYSNHVVLVCGLVFSEVLSALYLINKSNLNFADIKLFFANKNLSAIKKHEEFVRYGLMQDLINSVSQGVPVFLLNFYYGPTAVGYYSFAMKIVMAPVQIVSNATRQVFAKKFIDTIENINIVFGLYKKITSQLLVFGLVLAGVGFLSMEWLFNVFFGHSWVEAGIYAKWLVLWGVFLIINVPSTTIYRILDKQKLSFQYNVVMLLARTIFFIACGFYFSADVAVKMFAILGVIFNAVYIIIAYKIINKEVRNGSQ